ncbi:hypothetical protein N0V93_007907 [Gnomoniopsis smithogilvyi]|uniref:AB hydrolase-1 domain-containing protein n=1 Tax=Gnomoniopsis smithogilvyi TaxID=1191159 RepID=A0A9W9CU88_9PEZI|nr:hypothetical protein N0V93_007907 [Gnomoniopsis smithogilvyi]
MASLPPLPLSPGIRQRHIDLTAEPSCGLNIFVLEAGDSTKPLMFLFHGYPELAYTWRKVLLPLASHGYHVVAPDSRGYGRTSGWDTSSYTQTNLSQFTQMQLVLDNIALMRALGHESAALVVGHDFGATAASGCALARPDLFRAAVFISHVPTGSLNLPELSGNVTEARPISETQQKPKPAKDPDIHTSLARREKPLKHYQWYNSTPKAAKDWQEPPQGLRALLRGYVHLKSHVWKTNTVDMGRLTGWTADQLARMPKYYIMPLDATMPQVVENDMRDEDSSLTEAFVSDAELDVYVQEFSRTGFQGMLNWYRSSTEARNVNIQMAVFAGYKFQVPVTYIGGVADWGNYQRPGALEGLESGRIATDYRGTRILDGAGHWPQTEIPGRLCNEIVKFLAGG